MRKRIVSIVTIAVATVFSLALASSNGGATAAPSRTSAASADSHGAHVHPVGHTGHMDVAATAKCTTGPVRVTSDKAQWWCGSLKAKSPVVKKIKQCMDTGCDTQVLQLDLPKQITDQYGKHPEKGGVHVKLQLVPATPDSTVNPDDSVGVVIYDHKKQVVSETEARIGSGRSLLLPAVNGKYTVYVYYNPMEPTLGSPALKYEAYARFEKLTDASSTGPQLPDLEAIAQRNVTFDAPVTFFNDTASKEHPSCFISEVQEQGAKLCLRFGQAMANIGQGAMDIRYSTPPGTRPDVVQGYQRVHNAEGTYKDTPIGSMKWHEIHSHYHVSDFAQSDLWALDGNGNMVGTAPAATGKKNGFCAADTEIYWWSPEGKKAAVQAFPAPSCLDPKTDASGAGQYNNGISKGWADEYWWALPDQMIDVANLADGTYLLKTVVNPTAKIKEIAYGNNCIQLKVKLSGLKTSAPKAEVLAGSSSSCTT